MKKTFLALVAVLAMFSSAHAQIDLHILNHLAVGAEVGTMGWGVDASVPVTPFVDVQAGFTMFPQVTFRTSLSPNMPVAGIDKVPVRGEALMKGGKVLVNVMPIPMLTSFHVTAGAYIGPADIMGLYNPEPMAAGFAAYNATNPSQRLGLALGDYLLVPDENGNIDGKLRVFTAKPYVGIGIGRGVPKGRVGFKFDIGCIFWGKPTVWNNGEEVFDTDAGGNDGGAMKLITKLKVYPVLNFRVCGRII